MKPYLSDTSHSTSELIKLIFDEENALKEANKKHESLIKKSEFFYKEFTSKDMNEDFDEIHVMHDFQRMAEAKKEADQIQIEIKKLEASINAKEFSLKSLSGALLQIAKQGISIIHGDLSNCPDGRAIGSETLKNVIWQARNQSMHFEEGNPRKPVKACFANLERDFGSNFYLNTTLPENLARNVVILLGWTNHAAYEFDMDSIL